MFQLRASRTHVTHPHRPGPLAPIGALAGLVGVVVMAVLALATFGIALLFLRGRGARASRVGGARFGRVATPSPDPQRVRDPGADAAAGAGTAGSGHADGAAAPRRECSHAEVIEAWPLALFASLLLGGSLVAGGVQARLLVPMDDAQTDHLKAYGLAYWTLVRGGRAEWLLNYRGGSFLLPDGAEIEREARLRGVALEPVGGAGEAAIRAEIADNNMEAVALEKAPTIGVYIPPNTPPWDDAVTLALEYADIPYTKLWDEEVLRGDLSRYDWLHLHHEDFTGQHGKFYGAYHTFPWYQEEERVQKAMAAKLGFARISQLKGAVALTIKDYIARGGFMFGMCSATDTYDIALAALGVDIADVVYDGDPPDPLAQGKLDFSRTLAFKDFEIEFNPLTYRFSEIDVTVPDAATRGLNAFFTLFDFSAKNDPVPTMLIQNHVNAVPEFLGQTTGFHRAFLKSGVLVLGEVEGTDELKYLHGQHGRGTFTFLGGHDPEDFQHMVGDPATDLTKYKHSPGYRLILNNVLFPAAEKKKQRT